MKSRAGLAAVAWVWVAGFDPGPRGPAPTPTPTPTPAPPPAATATPAAGTTPAAPPTTPAEGSEAPTEAAEVAKCADCHEDQVKGFASNPHAPQARTRGRGSGRGLFDLPRRRNRAHRERRRSQADPDASAGSTAPRTASPATRRPNTHASFALGFHSNYGLRQLPELPLDPLEGGARASTSWPRRRGPCARPATPGSRPRSATSPTRTAWTAAA